MFVSFAGVSQASAETRTLKVYFIHTKERAEITYKRNGKFLQSGLDQLNRFLRDWRRNEPTRMDPRLFDMMWEMYRETGARDYIHVVSAYRSPATNAMLRSRSSGVAEKSQHTMGKAIDFYIPGVNLARLRAAALRREGGGVGYYPRSGAPFVHIDVGSVRHWPRMNRSELMALFPDGRTIHVPSDGKPLPGFQQAKAAYDQRQRTGASVQVASAGEEARSGNRGGNGLLAALFGRGGGADEEEDSAEIAAPARASAPARAAAPQPSQPVPAVETPETIIAALPTRSVPLPLAAPRPSALVGATATAPAEPPVAAAEAPRLAAVAEPEAEVPAPVVIELASTMPVPGWRPADTQQSPDALPGGVQVASAPSLPDAIPVSALTSGLPRTTGSDVISDMLAQSATQARSDVVINDSALEPVSPVLAGAYADALQRKAFNIGGETEDVNRGDVFVLASLPSVEQPMHRNADVLGTGARANLREDPGSVARKESRLAAISASSAASPRVAVLGRADGADAMSALESGVRTTAKSARPQSGQARVERRPMVMPVQADATRWALRTNLETMSVDSANGASTAYDVVVAPPRAVYTLGFQQGELVADANRFTGKAVAFISLARFE